MVRKINQHKRPSGAFCGWSGTEVSDRYPEAGCVGPSMSAHAPCPDSRVLCPASEVKLGDCIDVTALLGELDELDKTTRVAGEYEYARIMEESTRETPRRIVIHTEAGSWAITPETLLVLGPHQPDMVES